MAEGFQFMDKSGFDSSGNYYAPPVAGQGLQAPTILAADMPQPNSPELAAMVPPAPSPTTAPTATATIDPNAAAQQRNQAAELANVEAQKIYDSLGKTEIDTRESTKILAGIKEQLNAAPPAPTSLLQTFQQ